jgi:aldehyde:ferredoxin oxidoreductase
MPQSFLNKILRVNLTDGTTRVEEPGTTYYRRYMGGWNIIADTLLREVPPGADPLGPENKLIFATGVLTGLAISGAARHAVGAKSPLTGGFGAAEAGGFWGPELKQAGFDAIIIEGVSPKPVYLWIKDGKVELRDASHLWGKPTKETQEAIQKELGDDHVHCSLIGPAGENLVAFANIMSGLHDAAGRAGLGAVMGSKKLKAVAVRGTSRLEAADPDKVRKIAHNLVPLAKDISWLKVGTGDGVRFMPGVGNLPIRNFRDGEFPADKIDAGNWMKELGIGMRGCYACAVRCKKVVQCDAPYSVDPAYGGPEYESIASLGSCCGVDDPVAMVKAAELCNAYAMDTISTGVTIALAMECFENGLLNLEDTDGIDLRFGNGAGLVQIVEKIARREGIGDLLAEGTGRVAERIGGGAQRYAMHVKNQSFPAHEPRFRRALALGYAVSPTGPDHIYGFQDDSAASAGSDGFILNARLRSMGVLEPMMLDSLGPEKVRASVYHSMTTGALNCMPFCLFVVLGTGMSLDQQAEMVRAATGWDVNVFELLKVGERAHTLAQLFNVREGFTPDDDHLPERSYGPTIGGPLSKGGIDPDALRQAVRMYYGMMGWNRDTGAPLPEKLHELDVSWALDYLPEQ